MLLSFNGYSQKIVGYWRMDGDVNDASGNSYNGSAYSGSYIAGKNGKALWMNYPGNSNSYYLGSANNAGNAIQGDDSHTINTWVRLTSFKAYGGNLVRLTIDGTKFISNQQWAAGVSTTFYWTSGSSGQVRTYTIIAPSLNKWHMFTMIKKTATTGDLYIDCVLQTNYSGNFAASDNSANTEISFGFRLDGAMDDVQIYDYSITISDMKNEFGLKNGFFQAN